MDGCPDISSAKESALYMWTVVAFLNPTALDWGKIAQGERPSAEAGTMATDWLYRVDGGAGAREQHASARDAPAAAAVAVAAANAESSAAELGGAFAGAVAAAEVAATAATAAVAALAAAMASAPPRHEAEATRSAAVGVRQPKAPTAQAAPGGASVATQAATAAREGATALARKRPLEESEGNVEEATTAKRRRLGEATAAAEAGLGSVPGLAEDAAAVAAPGTAPGSVVRPAVGRASGDGAGPIGSGGASLSSRLVEGAAEPEQGTTTVETA
ncbi:hypothetical protein GPECTOR_67g315 [Gonium pectorale]|uniref:Uncharacterized protein n=1 Tax=Gonium pectorale TaxID=33097 RepID=A0A150G4M0_GONPE|nr:hypothetical protein GPECTOR_67g315 [Gonium pectorale]|eukprot:KXZ44475.1 hypothetical protein GPECTOR_67g315 [Gonium pectorale]